ncbi:MAG: hypothetical protein ABJB04_05035, partial [Betaproteobacteria bacterium]
MTLVDIEPALCVDDCKMQNGPVRTGPSLLRLHLPMRVVLVSANVAARLVLVMAKPGSLGSRHDAV